MVITIVILIILATVAVSFVFGEEGLISRAQQAAEMTERQELIEQIELTKAEVAAENGGKVTAEDFFEKLEENGIIGSVEGDVTDNGDGTFTVITNDGHEIEVTVTEDGEIEVEYVGKSDEPGIRKIEVSKTSNSVTITVETRNAEGGKLSYSYKKNSEGEESWQDVEANPDGNTCTINNLQQDEIYNIKVVLEINGEGIERIVNVQVGEMPAGTVAISFTNATWQDDGTANITINNKEEGYTLQYQIVGAGGGMPAEDGWSEIASGTEITESGMSPVKYVEGIGWVKTTTVDPGWYNYAEDKKQWANVVLGDASFTTSGEYEVLNENATYSMLVWIPRYAYQITSMYHQNGSGGGNIEIVFLDTANKDKDGTDYRSKTTYPSASTGSGMTDYVVHPAFTFGTDELAGFWVGKYETSNTAGYGDDDEPANNANLQIQIKAGVQSWRNITVSNIHLACTGMNNSDNSYYLSTDDSVVDPHMMKNTEWGAVAYLAQSKYGKGSEVTINGNGRYYTGGGNSATSYLSNKNQSTTGDETGIYDMSGCTWEYVAGYLQGGYDNYGSELMQADPKYSDVYTSYTAPSASTKLYGDAVYETSSSVSSPYTNSWYSDYSYFPYSYGPFFLRGGGHHNGTKAGLFYFYNIDGGDYSDGSFRVVVPVL